TRRGRPISFLTVTPYWLTEVGRFGLAWDTRFWVFTWSMSTLVPTSKVTLRFMVPSLAFVDIMYSMLSTPFICCSSGVATDCSIVRASAPVYVVETWITGGMIDGYCPTGSPVRETRPRITVT